MATLSGGHLAVDFSSGAVPALLPFFVLEFDLSYTATAVLMLAVLVSSSLVQPLFGLLSDPGRLRLLVALLEGEMCVCDLAASCGQSESSVSHALRLLRAHRVVEVRRAGRMAFYKLADAHVRLLLDVALTHVGHTTSVHAGPGPR